MGSAALLVRAVPGAIAFASTKTPVKPLAARATSTAACGGQIESTISERRQTSPTFDDGLRAQVVAGAVRRADAEQRWISLA